MNSSFNLPPGYTVNDIDDAFGDAVMKEWCCRELSLNLTLTIDSQDINECFKGKCPFCKKVASYGTKRSKLKQLTKNKKRIITKH